jgi:hypothetical protein
VRNLNNIRIIFIGIVFLFGNAIGINGQDLGDSNLDALRRELIKSACKDREEEENGIKIEVKGYEKGSSDYFLGFNEALAEFTSAQMSLENSRTREYKISYRNISELFFLSELAGRYRFA